MEERIKELEQRVEFLENLLNVSKSLPLAIQIFNAACIRFDVTKEEIRSDSQKNDIVEKRVAISNLLKELTNLGYADIGKIMNRDHATIIYHVKKKYYITGKLKEDYEFIYNEYKKDV